MTHPPAGRPTRASGRPGALAACLLALVLPLAGCSWFGGDDEPAARATAPSPAAQADPDVEITGADDVKVSAGVDAPELGSGAYFVSDLYDLSGPRLAEPALVRVVLQNALPEDTPVAVAVRATDQDPWTFLEGRLGSDRRHAELILSDLGTIGVVAVDTDTVTSGIEEGVTAALAADAARPDGVDEPTCTGTDLATQEGYAADSWDVETVGWCLDSVNDERVLRLTNLRGVPVLVTAPGGTERGTTGDAARADVDWDTWLDAAATGSGDGVDALVAPGRTLSVDADLEPGSSLLVTAADDPRSRAVQVLHALAVGLAGQVRAFGVVADDAAPAPSAVLGAWLQDDACSAALGGRPVAVARECLDPDSLTTALGPVAQLLAPALAEGAATSLVRAQAKALADAAGAVEQRLEITREAADYGPLVGRFTGSSRSLVVGAEGLVTETYGTATGPVMVVTYQLSDPETRGRTGSATATVTAVQVLDRAAARGRAPRVGQAGVLTLRTDGTVPSPVGVATYCTSAAARRCVDPAPTTPTASPSPAAAPVTPAEGSQTSQTSQAGQTGP